MTPVAASSPVVLVVDDEPQIRRFLEIALRAEGFQVVLAGSGEDGLVAATRVTPDMVVLDIGLPGIDGHDVLHRLRQWTDVPVLMLSVRDAEAEIVRALDAGADDYVTKPFGSQELVARIRALLRQRSRLADAMPQGHFDDGRLRIDLTRREVWVGEQRIALTRKEYAFLTLLLRFEGRILTHQQILGEIWGKSHVEDSHYLRIVVGKLRQKLGNAPTETGWITTVPGVGYRFGRWVA